MATFLGSPKVQYFKSGKQAPLAQGKVYIYASGTSSLTDSYPTIADAEAGTNPNTNPVVLNSRGEALIVLGSPSRVVVKSSEGDLIGSTDEVNAASQGNDSISYNTVANAVNYVRITNAAAGNAPKISSDGSDTNVGLDISSVGTSDLRLDGGATGDVDINDISTGEIEVLANTTCFETASVGVDLEVGSTLEVTSLNLSGGATATGALSGSGIDVPNAVNFIPPGLISWYAGSAAPTGWLLCNGAAISRTTYSALFAAVSTTYGAGDGSTTFTLPAQARRALVGLGGAGTGTLSNTAGSTGGSETHTLITAEMPAHTHTLKQSQLQAIYAGTGNTQIYDYGGGSSGNNTGGSAHNNMQPSLVLNLIIKAF